MDGETEKVGRKFFQITIATTVTIGFLPLWGFILSASFVNDTLILKNKCMLLRVWPALV